MAVSVDRKRKRERAEVDLVTPHGTEITVTASRADQLLARDPIGFNDGVFRKYAYAGESNVVEMRPKTTVASAPRKGSGANTGGE